MDRFWLPIVLLIVALWLPACEGKPEGNDTAIVDVSQSGEVED